MKQQRWLRIIPVALIMYTISYIDRTNISLALDPNISTMMKDLLMDDRMKGEAAGIFFFGYILLGICCTSCFIPTPQVCELDFKISGRVCCLLSNLPKRRG